MRDDEGLRRMAAGYAGRRPATDGDEEEEGEGRGFLEAGEGVRK